MTFPYINGDKYQSITQKAVLNGNNIVLENFPFTFDVTSQSNNIVAIVFNFPNGTITAIGIINCKCVDFATAAGSGPNNGIRGTLYFHCNNNFGNISIISENGPYAIASPFAKIN